MVIKNQTKITSEEVYKTLINMSKKNNYKRLLFAGFLAVLGAIIVIIVYLRQSQADTLAIGFIFIGFALVFALMTIVSNIRLPKTIKKQYANLLENGIENFFTFKEESFALTIKAGTQSTKKEYAYKDLKKIVEYNDRIIFMPTADEVHICKKNSFSSSKELDLFFYGLSKHKTKIKDKKQKK